MSYEQGLKSLKTRLDICQNQLDEQSQRLKHIRTQLEELTAIADKQSAGAIYYKLPQGKIKLPRHGAFTIVDFKLDD